MRTAECLTAYACAFCFSFCIDPIEAKAESVEVGQRLRVAQSTEAMPRSVSDGDDIDARTKDPDPNFVLPEVVVKQKPAAPADATRSTKSKSQSSPQTAVARKYPAQSATPEPGAETSVGQPAAETEQSSAPPPTGTVGAPPAPYAGGQVGTGGQVGLLGNRNVFDTPYSMTSYTAKAIADQQATTIGSVLENNPSVRSVGASSGVYDNFMIRGFPVSASAYSLNGLPGAAPAQMVAPEFIDRVELFLGPSGMLSNMPLFGATGGSVNLVTKHAYDAPLTSLTTGYFSDGQSYNHLDVSRRYGAGKEWGIRFNGVYRDGATAIDNQDELLGLGALALDYSGSQFRTSLDIGYQDQEWTAPFLSMLYNGPAGQVPRAPEAGSNPFQPWSFNDADDFFATWLAEVDVARNVTVFAGVGYRDDLSVLLSPYQEIEDRGGNTTVYPYYEPYSSENFAANAGVRANAVTGPIAHKLRFGWQTQLVEIGWYDTFFNDFSSNIYDPVIGKRPRILGLSNDPPTTLKYNLSSVAAVDTLSILDEAIQVTLGVRRQSINSDSFDSNTGDLTNSYDKSANTPTYGVIIKPFKRLSLYGNYIEGLDEGPVAPSGTANAGQSFAPFVSKQYETGLKIDLGKLGFTFAAFQITQPSGFVNAATNTFVVDGEQRNRGLEFNTFGELTKSLRILGGVSFIEGVLTQTEGGIDDGNVAPGVPDVQVSLSSEWDLPSVRGLTLIGRMLYSSGSFYDTANTITLPDWTRFDIGLRYETIMLGRDMIFRGTVENVADSSYWASAAEGTLTLSTPRRFLATATAKF